MLARSILPTVFMASPPCFQRRIGRLLISQERARKPSHGSQVFCPHPPYWARLRYGSSSLESWVIRVDSKSFISGSTARDLSCFRRTPALSKGVIGSSLTTYIVWL